MSQPCVIHQQRGRKFYQFIFIISLIVLLPACAPKTVEDVHKITSQSRLIEIAANNKNSVLIKSAAVEKITNQELLANYALDSPFSLIRSAATKNLKDNALLAKMAQNDPMGDTRREAIRHLTDQTILEKIAQNNSLDEVTRSTAVENLTNQTLLKEIALKDEAADVRIAAMEKIIDQRDLAEVVFEEFNERACKRGIDRITDQKILAEIAYDKEFSWDSLSPYAIDKITDQKILAEVVRKTHRLFVNLYALSKLTDNTLLSEFIDYKYHNVKTLAKLKLALIAPISIKMHGNLTLKFSSYIEKLKYGANNRSPAIAECEAEIVDIQLLKEQQGKKILFKEFTFGEHCKSKETFSEYQTKIKKEADLNWDLIFNFLRLPNQ